MSMKNPLPLGQQVRLTSNDGQSSLVAFIFPSTRPGNFAATIAGCSVTNEFVLSEWSWDWLSAPLPVEGEDQ